MSRPVIKMPDEPVERCQAINDLIESIALVETGLSHIVNAEGEKIQKVIKYNDSTAEVPIEEILTMNDSVSSMIGAVTKLELILQSKLQTAVELEEAIEML